MDHPTNYNYYLTIAERVHADNEEMERQQRIAISRQLFAGTLPDELVKQLKSMMLARSAEFPNLINLVEPVITEITDRLVVVGAYDAPQQDGADASGSPVAWADDWWQDAGLDALQFELYENARVDGEAFLMLEPFDSPAGVTLEPRVQPVYVDARAGGSGAGFRAHYENGRLKMISHRWTEWHSIPASFGRRQRREQRRRCNLYIPESAERDSDGGWLIAAARIEKYVRNGANWIEFKAEENGSWPLWWTDDGAATGNSLPLPVVHFRNPRGKPEALAVAGSQSVLDDMLAALVVAAGMHGKPMLSVVGGYPTRDGQPIAADGSNLWQLGAGQVVGHPKKTPDQFSVDHVEPGDLSQIMAAIDKIVMLTAITRGTPSLLVELMGGGDVSGETLKQVDIRPIASTVRLQTVFGNGWSQVFAAAGALLRHFEVDGAPETDAPVHTRWRPADVRGSDSVVVGEDADSGERVSKGQER